MNVYDLINCAGEMAEPAWVHSCILCDIVIVWVNASVLIIASYR